MSDLQHFHAKVCLTATAWLWHDQKVLLIHHKKLGIWLAPGGHVDEGELPHKAAERECWEETGLKVRTITSNTFPKGKESEFVPNPFASNLHWVCRENYDVRHGKADPSIVPEGWRKRGCEQHVALSYIVEPIDGVNFKQNVEETLGIGWFTREEIQELDTIDDVRLEAGWVFEYYRKV